MLIKGRQKVGIKILENPKAFIDYSETIDGVYEDLEDYNPTKKRRVLIVFDDMIANIESSKTLLLLNCFQERENSTFHMFLFHNLISKCLKL